MRHRKKINHLGRTSSHRKSMLANMASSLIMHKRISTTTAKAKALRIYVEPLLTKSKDDTTHSRRIVFSYLKNKEAVSELFREVAQKIAGRPGGYTRILKTGSRLGDNADMCIIELVDYNENMLAAVSDSKATAKRSRRGKKKSTASIAEAAATAPMTEKASEKAVKVTEPVAEVETVEDTTVVQKEAAEIKEVVKEDDSELADEKVDAGEEDVKTEEKKPAARKKASKKEDAKEDENEKDTE